MKTTIKCKNCGKVVTFSDHYHRKYCSRNCLTIVWEQKYWQKYYQKNKEKILDKNKKWAKTPIAKEHRRLKIIANKPDCVICGQKIPFRKSKFCSKECRRIVQNIQKSLYDKKRRMEKKALLDKP